MATVGSLVFEMSVGIARMQQDMAKALTTVQSATDGMNSAIGTVRSAFEMLGVGLSVHAFTSFIENGIEAEAQLHRLSLTTGLAIETLSALRPIAKQAGTDLESVSPSVNKLEKNMLTFAQNGTGKMAAAFAQLHYSRAQVQAGLQNMDEFLPEFARRLLESGKGGETAGISMQLLGKNLKDILPFIEELAKKTTLVGTETAAQVAAAHEFEVSLAKLKGGSTLLAISLANELLPRLNEIATAMLKAKEKGDGFFIAIAKGMATAVHGSELTRSLKDYDDTILQISRHQKMLEQDTKSGNAAAIAADEKGLALLNDKKAALQAHIELKRHEQGLDKPEKEKTPLTNMPDTKAADDAAKELARLQAEDRKGYLDGLQVQMDADDAFYKETGKLADEASKHLAELQKEDRKGLLDGIQAQLDASDNYYREVAAMQDKAKKNNDIARELGMTFTSAFENSIVKGESFRKVLTGIYEDIAKIIMRKTVTEPLGNAVASAVGSSSLGSLFSNLFSSGDAGAIQLAGPRAAGGPVSSGSAYLVGEQGPEIMVPDSSGTIVPNGATGAMGGVNITQHINVDSRSDRASIMAAMSAAKQSAMQEISNLMYRGDKRFRPAG